jgi:hypothetical protein
MAEEEKALMHEGTRLLWPSSRLNWSPSVPTEKRKG